MLPLLLCWTALAPNLPGPIFVLPIQPEEYVENQLDRDDGGIPDRALELCQAQRRETVVKADTTIAVRLDSLEPEEIE